VLSIHPDGRVLLSAGSATSRTAIIILIASLGDDALVVLWNLETGEILQEISCSYMGFVTAACWITTMRNEVKAFAFGCVDGSIHVYALDRGDVSCFYASICDLDLRVTVIPRYFIRQVSRWSHRRHCVRTNAQETRNSSQRLHAGVVYKRWLCVASLSLIREMLSSHRFHHTYPRTHQKKTVHRPKCAILWSRRSSVGILFGKPRNVCILQSYISLVLI